MHPDRTSHDVAREELHVDLMGRNLFRNTLILAAAFCSAAFYILMQ
jgi:hypothetical protein